MTSTSDARLFRYIDKNGVVHFANDEKIAESNINQPKNKPIVKSGTVYKVPKDKDLSQIPKEFTGDDIDSVFAQFDQSQFKKDQFETTTDFRKRIQSMNLGNMIYFFKTTKGMATYDADKEILSINLGFMHYFDEKCASINLKFNSVEVGSYIGSNMFGVSKKIIKEERTSSGIIALNVKFDNYLNNKINVKMSAKDAKELKRNKSIIEPGIFFVCVPQMSQKTNSVTTTIKNWRTPTIDFPYDIQEKERCVFVNLFQVWIYNPETGKIYSKYKY